MAINMPGSGGVNFGGGGLSELLQNLLQQLTGGQTAANQANEQRYEQLLALSAQDRARIKEGFGKARKQVQVGRESRVGDIGQQFAGLQAQTGQDLVSRGLTATSIAPTLRTGIERQKATALDRLASQFAQQDVGLTLGRTQALSGETQRRAGFIERRTDQGPNLSQILPLLLQLAQGGGLGGLGSLGNLGSLFGATST